VSPASLHRAPRSCARAPCAARRRQPPTARSRAGSVSDAKGFGFIAPEAGGDDIFVHHSAIATEGYHSLADDEPIEYELIVAEDGRVKAANVTGPNRGPLRGVWGTEQPTRGVVVKWRQDKGFGFIKPESGDTTDIFVHQSVIVSTGFRELAEGTEVEFTTQMENGRVKCKKVRAARTSARARAPASGPVCARRQPAHRPRARALTSCARACALSSLQVTGRGGKPLPGADRESGGAGVRPGGMRDMQPPPRGGAYGYGAMPAYGGAPMGVYPAANYGAYGGAAVMGGPAGGYGMMANYPAAAYVGPAAMGYPGYNMGMMGVAGMGAHMQQGAGAAAGPYGCYDAAAGPDRSRGGGNAANRYSPYGRGAGGPGGGGHGGGGGRGGY
jgi:cold shock CspA family protein